jgi:16S rRNA (cytidine1402-2'-O)-methyltransferase
MSELVYGTLYLVPNLLGLTEPADVLPVKTIQVASQLTYFLVETPKAARHFLKTLPLAHRLQDVQMEVLPELGASANWEQLLAPLKAGQDVGVVSDAGCPGIADPGAQAVAAAHRMGARVIPLVGPSSIFLALMASGFNGQSFKFHGYLPIEMPARLERLKRLQDDVQHQGTTQLFIETPYRNTKLLADIVGALSPKTEVALAVALTTAEEVVIRSSVKGLASRLTELEPILNRKPALFLIGRS